MTWLWSSIVPEINDTYMFLPNAREIWEAVKQTYSKVHDATQYTTENQDYLHKPRMLDSYRIRQPLEMR